jgi:DNA polymerase-3 subunit epsilon
MLWVAGSARAEPRRRRGADQRTDAGRRSGGSPSTAPRATPEAVRQKLFDYLLERPGGATPRELLDLVFTQQGADPEFGRRFIQALLAPDPRFVWRASDGCWAVRLHDVLAQPLAACTFVVVDLETTGLGVSPQGIIEIGAARVTGGRVVEEFQQLVNPETRVPPFITGLTGIDDAMLADQPRIAAVWPRFAAFVGDDVLVAHNATFDLGFLNAAAMLYGGGALSNAHLCTLKLARRLLPELRRRGIDALAAHFGIPQSDRHRALGDVRITVEILFQLLEHLAARGIVRLDQALDLQHHARDGRRFVCRLPRATVERLPAAPGIYRLFDGDGRLLYIGKAKSLRERVGNYLSNAAGHSNKTLDLIRHAHDVRVEVCGSELEAALEEAAAIRREQPPYNRLGKHLPRIAFLKVTVADAYPRLTITDKLGSRPARYLGPFRNRDEAARALAVFTRLFRLRTCNGRLRPDPTFAPCFQGQVDACTAPCAARVTAESYRAQVDACVAWFDGSTGAAERELTRRRDVHAEAVRLEAAAKAQRDLELLRALDHRRRTLGWVTAQDSFIVFQPSVERRLVLAYVVLVGRLALRARLHDPEQVDGLAAQVQALMPATRRTRLQPGEVDGTTILAAWIRDRGDSEGSLLPLALAGGGAQWPATQVAVWRAVCASLLTRAVDTTDASAVQPVAPHPEEQRHGGEQPGRAPLGPVAD